jgi:hypothetical protein
MSDRHNSSIGVSFRLGERVMWMVPGDVLGRHHRCAVVLRDRRISEAHAMLSLRGGSLNLLNLRGGLRVNGRPVRDPRLHVGLTLEVAPDLALEVVDVLLPSRILALKGPGIDHALDGSCSLLTGEPRLVPGHVEGSLGRFWQDGLTWYADTAEGEHALIAGAPLVLGAWAGTVEERSLVDASVQSTRSQSQNIEVHTCFDTVQIFREGTLLAAFGGMKARLLHELAELDGPVEWTLAARMLWTQASDYDLRRRWDKTLSRLRVALRDAGIRDDLVRASGTGHVELLLYPGDQVRCRD